MSIKGSMINTPENEYELQVFDGETGVAIIFNEDEFLDLMRGLDEVRAGEKEEVHFVWEDETEVEVEVGEQNV